MNTFDRSRPIFYALDFDRCLGDVEALSAFFNQIVVSMEFVEPDALFAARRSVERSGGSFDVVQFLQDEIGDVATQLAIERFCQAPTNESFLLPGAAELLAFLTKANLPHGIVTFGGERWQHAKLRRCGLEDVPTMVLDTPQKAKMIRSWYDDSLQCFVLPADFAKLRSNKVVLIDDKAMAFDGIDEQSRMRGYFVQSNRPPLLSQEGSVPPSVRTVQSLHEIVNYEQKLLT